jgi:hypothetical protein
MKKIFLIFLASSFASASVFANDDDRKEGIFKTIVADDTERASQSSSLPDSLQFNNLLDFRLKFDDHYLASKRSNEFKDTNIDSRLYSDFRLAKNFFIKSYLRLSEINNESENTRRSKNSIRGGGDRSFENLALEAKEFNLGYENDEFALFAGKFILNFGSAWRWNQGIWIHDVARGYQQDEKIGIATILKAGELKKTGRYYFTFASFTNDRKNFDGSLITKKDSVSKSDAKAGDTRSLKSYSMAVDVNFDFSEREKLFYHFSYLHMAVNEAASSVPANQIDSQKGFVLSMNYQLPVSENTDGEFLLEYLEQKNINGNPDQKENYLTVGLVGKLYQQFNLTLANTRNRSKVINQSNFNQDVSEISLGYNFRPTRFFDKLALQTGYKKQRIHDNSNLSDRNSYGVLLRYYKNF